MKKLRRPGRRGHPVQARSRPIELYWKDEAQIGQQGTLTRIWAARGSRPPAPRDQRYSWAYLFSAICPACGIGAGLVLPSANGYSMNEHLAEISHNVATDAHAIVILDGAGWHRPGGKPCTPANLSLLPLLPYSSELNPVGNVWAYLRDNHLSNRVDDSHGAIVDACCKTWNALIADPAHVTSFETREWAQVTNQRRWY